MLGELAAALLEQGDARGAASRYEMLADGEPLREEWHRGVMTARAASGEVPLALRQFHRCRTVLREELGVEPGEETRSLYMHLLTGGQPALGVVSATR